MIISENDLKTLERAMAIMDRARHLDEDEEMLWKRLREKLGVKKYSERLYEI